jgi:alpha-ketoglutarate-dependent taurine dioxygenase
MAIQVSQLHPTLGAEVRGVDLTLAVTPEVFAEIEAAFNRYGILVFPEQPVSDEQQLAFSRLFGPLEVKSELCRRQDAAAPRYRRHLEPRRRRAGAGA